jgi:hypothetical protein
MQLVVDKTCCRQAGFRQTGVAQSSTTLNGADRGFVVISRPKAMKIEEGIECNHEGLMQEAASDELFLADLNATLEDFGHADQEDHEILTMDRLVG